MLRFTTYVATSPFRRERSSSATAVMVETAAEDRCERRRMPSATLMLRPSDERHLSRMRLTSPGQRRTSSCSTVAIQELSTDVSATRSAQNGGKGSLKKVGNHFWEPLGTTLRAGIPVDAQVTRRPARRFERNGCLNQSATSLHRPQQCRHLRHWRSISRWRRCWLCCPWLGFQVRWAVSCGTIHQDAALDTKPRANPFAGANCCGDRGGRAAKPCRPGSAGRTGTAGQHTSAA